MVSPKRKSRTEWTRSSLGESDIVEGKTVTGNGFDRQIALRHLGWAGGLGSFLGSSAIVALSATITMWQNGLGLGTFEVGALSAVLNFAIAAGSLSVGVLCSRFGLTRVFGWSNLVAALGFLTCALAPGFPVLLVGVVLAGLGTGVDLPVSLSTLTRDADDPEAGSRLVTITQVGWQAGMLASVVLAFVVSPLHGAAGGRAVFLVLAVVATALWLWRIRSAELRELHKLGERSSSVDGGSGISSGTGVRAMFADDGGRRYLRLFVLLMVFYVFWNLLANTWAQFQTYMLVNADASQTLATGLGIVLYVVMLGSNMLVSATVNTRWRNPLFVAGGVLSLAAMVMMAVGGGTLAVTVVATGIMYLGMPLAGEAICKVWTQESFPGPNRAAVQGVVLGLSRVVCASFAFVAPALVLPGTIGPTLWCFVGVVAISFAAGLAFMKARGQMLASNVGK